MNLFLLYNIYYKINFDKSVSLTKVSKFLFILNKYVIFIIWYFYLVVLFVYDTAVHHPLLLHSFKRVVNPHVLNSNIPNKLAHVVDKACIKREATFVPMRISR